MEAYLDLAALREAFYIPFQGGCKSHLVEQRRVQQMRNGTNLARELLCEVGVFSNSCGGRRANTIAFSFHHGQVHPHCGNNLPYAIVQFARDTVALFVLHLQEAAGKFTHNFGLFAELDVRFLKLAGTLGNASL